VRVSKKLSRRGAGKLLYLLIRIVII
jgi:hypothetical protein